MQRIIEARLDKLGVECGGWRRGCRDDRSTSFPSRVLKIYGIGRKEQELKAATYTLLYGTPRVE